MVRSQTEKFWLGSRGEHFPKRTYDLSTEEEVAQAKESFRNRAMIERWQWKQATPQDQATAVLMSLGWHLENFEGNIIDRDTFLLHAKNHLEQLDVLKKLVGPGAWQ